MMKEILQRKICICFGNLEMKIFIDKKFYGVFKVSNGRDD